MKKRSRFVPRVRGCREFGKANRDSSGSKRRSVRCCRPRSRGSPGQLELPCVRCQSRCRSPVTAIAARLRGRLRPPFLFRTPEQEQRRAVLLARPEEWRLRPPSFIRVVSNRWFYLQTAVMNLRYRQRPLIGIQGRARWPRADSPARGNGTMKALQRLGLRARLFLPPSPSAPILAPRSSPHSRGAFFVR